MARIQRINELQTNAPSLTTLAVVDHSRISRSTGGSVLAKAMIAAECKAEPWSLSAALRARSPSMRRASARARSDPPVTSLATSCTMLTNSFMAYLPIGAVVASNRTDRRKLAVSTAFEPIVAAVNYS
jgi:hypothetical protein